MNYTTPATDLVGAFDVPSTSAPSSTTRTQQLQQLFISNYSAIRDAVSDFGPNLYVGDIDNLTAGISDHLDQAPDEPSEFLAWAVSLASESARQASAFIAMRTEQSENVRRAIRSVISSCTRLGATIDNGLPPDQLGAELDETDTEDEQTKLSTLDSVDEIEQTVWLRVLADLPGWLTPGYSDTPGYGPATMKTRLWGFARLQALGWRKTRLREFARYVELEDLEPVA